MKMVCCPGMEKSVVKDGMIILYISWFQRQLRLYQRAQAL